MFEDLPALPEPYLGECPSSWLARARLRSNMSPSLWARLVGGNPAEPERGRLTSGRAWAGFPHDLMDISLVPVRWRVFPALRTMHCVRCATCRDGPRKLPQLTRFLDSRCLVCPVHGLWLSYGDGIVAEVPKREPLLLWLSEWIEGQVGAVEAMLRHDLTAAFFRNWTGLHGGCVAAYRSPDLPIGFPRLPDYRQQWPPGQPLRLGALSPCDRLSVLVSAHGSWRAIAHGANGPVGLPESALV